MTLWIATSNQGKIKEFQTLLPEFALLFPTNLKDYQAPEETGTSFKENAKLKAWSLKKLKSKEWIIAEDSGLEVLALNKAPGHCSARYAGPKATDQENLDLLMKNLTPFSFEQRLARFVSHIIALSPTGKEFSCQGTVEGHIAEEAKGNEGFGYDPVFIPLGQTKSFAELNMEYKNSCSHRFKAVQQLKKKCFSNGE